MHFECRVKIWRGERGERKRIVAFSCLTRFMDEQDIFMTTITDKNLWSNRWQAKDLEPEKKNPNVTNGRLTLFKVKELVHV